MNKEELLDVYRTLRKDLGKIPTVREFLKVSRVSKPEVTRKFRTYNEMVRAAGDTPNFTPICKIYTDEEYLNSYGSYIRRFKELPNQNTWMFHGINPVPRSYRKRFRLLWRDMPRLFHSYAKDLPEWKDVIGILEENDLLPGSSPEIAFSDIPYTKPEVLGLVPAVLQNFKLLSYGAGSPLEFERKSAQIFTMLGYETVMLGQGKGRNPDGVAEDAGNRYAILFDAKSRRERYTPGTDDRQICEYIRSQRKVLTPRGFEVIYYLIISSEFGAISPEWTFLVQSVTGTAVSFITAENLLKLLSKKIGDPRGLDTDLIKKLFVRGGEITGKDIEELA